MKVITFVSAICLMIFEQPIFAQQAAAPSWRIRPIQMVSIGQIPADLPMMMTPHGAMGFRSKMTTVTPPQPGAPFLPPADEDTSGTEITYLIEGQNIVRFQSLAIDQIKTPEGTNLAKTPTGVPRYEAGPFPQTSTDGKYCVCTLRLRGNQFDKVDQLAIQGQASVLMATKRQELKVDLTLGDKRVLKSGPFALQIMQGTGPAEAIYIPAPSSANTSVPVTTPGATVPQQPTATLGPPEKNDGAPPKPPVAPVPEYTNAAPPPADAQAMIANLFGFPTSDPKDLCTVELKGPLKTVISLDFFDGANELQPSSSWDDTTGHYSMTLPKSDKVQVRIIFATETQVVNLPIGK